MTKLRYKSPQLLFSHLFTHNDTVRQLKTQRQTVEEATGVFLSLCLGQLLLDILVHIICVHLLDGEDLLLVLNLVCRDVLVGRKACYS